MDGRVAWKCFLAFVGHRASGEVGQPGGAAWRSSLAGQPAVAACADACADVGCIDCRIDAGRCVRVEVCWIDIRGDARDAAIDVGCIEGCILAAVLMPVLMLVALMAILLLVVSIF